jgi:hypothetical protein
VHADPCQIHDQIADSPNGLGQEQPFADARKGFRKADVTHMLANDLRLECAIAA